MKYTWDTIRFPNFRDGSEEIGPADLFDANGKQLGPYIVSFDSKTGEIWEHVKDEKGNILIDHEKGEAVLKHSVHPAPLRWESLSADPKPIILGA